MKKSIILSLLLLTLSGHGWAQSRAVSGRVTDRATNEGLPGVTVIVKDQPTIGTSTNADGSFSLDGVPDAAPTLIMSYVGYATQEVAITGLSTVSVALATDTKQLSEVVVTALGIERTRNSLAYSATTVTGNDITIARNPNAINGLSGKVAGLAITQSNTLGGSSNVIIRGTKSLFGNNQALFVIDGVPISNDNTNTADQRTGRSGYDYGNAAADINPDDIATTTVLKGAAATALYGERAANGVILITTKKGRKGINVTLNSGVTAGRIDKSTFIKYQKQYGAGYGAYFNEDGNGKPVAPTADDASYGNAFDPNLNVFQWEAYTPGSPNFGKATPWVAASNDPSTFFKTAVSTLNSVTVDGGSDLGSFKLGYTNNIERGVLPNSKVTKDIVNFGATLNITPKLTTSATVNFSRTAGLGRYGTGYGSENLMTNFRQWWQTNVDIKAQEAAYNFANQNATWNLAQPEDEKFAAIYWNNPYFVRYQNFENDSRFRTFGNVATTYKVTDWFNVLGRVTLDSYDEQQEERAAIGSTQASYVPYYSRYNRSYREMNLDLIGNFSKSISEDFSFQGLLGTNVRRQYIKSVFGTTNGGLALPDLYSLSNSLSGILPSVETDQRIGVDGVFASTTFGYRDRVFLDLTVRRDKSTTLAVANNSFIYPSASLGYVFSESLHEQAPWLSYGKIRANYAEVGQGAPPLSLYNYYIKRPAFGSVALAAISSTKNNVDLKPERTRSGEVGIETAFLDNRVGVEATYYQQNTIDQIIPLRVSTASGYVARFINSGEVRNRGVEVTAYVVPVKTTDFTWRLSANWTRNRNEVLSLFNGVDNIVLATYQGGISSNGTIGQPFGSLRGSDYVYRDGQKVVNALGTAYLMTNSQSVIGNPNPNWRGGITNSILYKGIALTFLVDIKQGGQVFSLDRYYGLSGGLQPETAGNNDLGNPSRLSVADGGGIILPGVKEDGTPNTTRVANDATGLYGYGGNPNAGFVYDASFVKLREATLTYSLPKALTTRLGFVRGVDFSVVGRNLWIIHKNLPDADPEEGLSSGNLGQGYQSGSYPTTRSLGANVRLNF